MLISAGDLFIAGNHSTISVAAIGVAIGVYNPVFLFGIGMTMGISPALAIKRGKSEDTHQYLKSILLYTFIIGIFLSLITKLLNNFVPYMGIDQELIPFVQRYIDIILWSFPFAYLFQGIKEYFQSFEKVVLANTIATIAVFINLGVNYILVFGLFVFPKLGFDGLAYASFIIRVFLAIAIFIPARKYLFMGKIDFTFIRYIFKFSFSIAIMFFVEVLAFSAVSILIGGMGVAVSAANNIILNIASITFMLPYSISNAVSVKVGAKFGKNDFYSIKKYAFSALFISISFMIMTAICYILFPKYIINIVSHDPDVVIIGVSLLSVVAIFQVADGIQITLAGILRGMEKTKQSFYSVLIGYWCVGLPIGAVLAYHFHYGAKGLWIGIASSLILVAISLSFIFKHQFKK